MSRELESKPRDLIKEEIDSLVLGHVSSLSNIKPRSLSNIIP